MTKKIFFILKDYKKNQLGAEKAQYYISQYFIKYTNWSVIIYCKSIEKKEKINLEQYNNIKLIIKNNFYSKLLFCLYNEKPDYFFSWRWEYNLLAALVCKVRKIKNICFIHSFLLEEIEISHPDISVLKMFLYKSFCKVTLLKFIDRIFVPSHSLRDYLIKDISNELKDKITIQYNGIENNETYKKDLNMIDKQNVLYLGGFQKLKGIFNLLKIAKQNSNINFYVYGILNTEYKERILSFIKNENLKNIKIKGFSSNIENVYKKFNIMIFPSELDSFPFSIIESMKYGLIIISTIVGELKYILKNNYNSIIFDGETFNFSKLNDYNLKKIAQNTQKDFLKKFTLRVYKNILNELVNLT